MIFDLYFVVTIPIKALNMLAEKDQVLKLNKIMNNE